MAKTTPKVRPSDLPTKVVTSSDGTKIRMKVVQAESPTLADDLLAAFSSNVTRIRAEQKKRAIVAENAP